MIDFYRTFISFEIKIAMAHKKKLILQALSYNNLKVKSPPANQP
ncbi:MAG: hypothetical protein ACI9DK_000467 [Vicingaceae bacterium]|jgi:hypothetical protein